MSTTLADIQKQIEEIKRDCSFENWDGEDGLPPTEAALAKAEKYAAMHLDAGFGGIHLGPLSDGGMDVELWAHVGDKSIRVVFHIGSDGNVKGGIAGIFDEK